MVTSLGYLATLCACISNASLSALQLVFSFYWEYCYTSSFILSAISLSVVCFSRFGFGSQSVDFDTAPHSLRTSESVSNKSQKLW